MNVQRMRICRIQVSRIRLLKRRESPVMVPGVSVTSRSVTGTSGSTHRRRDAALPLPSRARTEMVLWPT